MAQPRARLDDQLKMQQDWQRIRHLFDSAVELPPERRSAWLDDVCDDVAVRAEVDALLRSADMPGPLDALGARLASVRDVLADAPPERAGPYIIDAPIGRGGMGVVYRAHDPRLKRDVAIKFLPLSIPAGSSDTARMLAEARTSSQLDHPNICTIYDIGHLDEDDRVFIAMAYCPRGTLEDRLRSGPLAVAEAVNIARQVADALETAHAAGVVHRDIKPANVAFGERDEVKVLDFGVAIIEHDPAVNSYTAGTPSYMAPEQARGGIVDARSDVWAVGVLLYEMLTGRKPFTGATRAEILEAITNSAPVPLRQLREDAPPAVADVVHRALAPDPARRFGSAAQLRDALRASQLAPQVAARRRRFAAAAGIMILLSVMGALAVYDRPAPEPGMSGDPLLDEQFRRGRDRWAEGTPEGIEAAAVILKNVVDRDSTHARARAYLAIAYAESTMPSFSRQLQREWLDSAVTHGEAAVRLEPRLPYGHAALGVTYRWLGRMDEALRHHERALSFDPDFALSIQEIGLIHSFHRRRADAVRWLERGVRLDPDARSARRRLASIYRSYRMSDEARHHIREGRLRAPDDASLIWESVMLELETGDTSVARADFELYLQLQPPGERDRMRAWFEILRGDHEAAGTYIDRLDLERSPWYDLRVFGLTYILLGRRTEGERMLRAALDGLQVELDAPDWPRGSLSFQVAYLHASLGDQASALAALHAWLDDDGLGTWDRLDLQPGWGTLVQNPEFQQIMRISEQRFLEQRTIISDELRRLRDQ